MIITLNKSLEGDILYKSYNILVFLLIFLSCEDKNETIEPLHPFIGIWKNTHIYQNEEWTLNDGNLIYWHRITDNTNTSIMERNENDGTLCYFIGTENQFEPVENGDYYTVNSGVGNLIYLIENGMLVYKSNINSSTYSVMTRDNSISFDPICND